MTCNVISRAVAAAFLAVLSSPALACQSYVGPMNLDYGVRAELIVIGRITDVERVTHEIKDRPGEMIPLSIYSRIHVAVDSVLAGNAGPLITAIVDKWPDGGMPNTSTGPVLIAMEDLSASDFLSRIPGRAGAGLPATRGMLTVVEEPCRMAFVFDAGSEEARSFLAKWRQAHPSP